MPGTSRRMCERLFSCWHWSASDRRPVSCLSTYGCPKAHPEAPSPVSALMSGAMVALGVYGIVLVGDDLLGGGPVWWWLVVLVLGGASALFGSLHAASSTDLKRLLAYSTTDNIGLVLLAVGATGTLRRHQAPAPGGIEPGVRPGSAVQPRRLQGRALPGRRGRSRWPRGAGTSIASAVCCGACPRRGRSSWWPPRHLRPATVERFHR